MTDDVSPTPKGKPPDANDILGECGPDGLRAASDAAPTITNQAELAKARGPAANDGSALSKTVVLRLAAPVNSIPILSSGDFVRGFRPPDYVIDGIIQRGFIYSLTGKTGSGKTAVSLRILAQVATGLSLAGREVEQGTCVMFVGENADDVRMRWIALLEIMGIDPEIIPVRFVEGVFSLAALRDALERKTQELGPISLVLVDTSAAYFEGDNENDNVQQGIHARMLRSFTGCLGRPAVIVNCHPTKNATDDVLLPRGGGAFIAEVDGNLTAKNADGVATVHWQGKFRGPEFSPLMFELIQVSSDRLRDSKGRHVPTVYARPLSTGEAEEREFASDRETARLLAVMNANPNASISDLATKAGWILSNGNPHKSKVERKLTEFKKEGLAEKVARHWTLTIKGKKAASRLNS